MRIIVLCLLLCVVLYGHAGADPVRMNQVQVIGTHNSYHIAPDPAMIKTAVMFDKGAAGWNYTNPPLNEQLDAGIRSFEIDLNYMEGGIHVFHVPVMDQNSTCPMFKDCLGVVLAWSKEHPNHVPISLLLEIKEDYALWNKSMGAWDAKCLDQLDAEVREVLPEDKLITPDMIRGKHATLEEAVTTDGWPLLSEAKGRIMLAVHEEGRLRDLYIDGHPSLEGRPCFLRSEPGYPYSAFIVADDPDDPHIPEWTKAGYYIRTRADSGVVHVARGGDARRDIAFGSGAQIVSTDFPPGRPDEKSGYVVSFEGKGFRCNPVNHEGDCGELEK